MLNSYHLHSEPTISEPAISLVEGTTASAYSSPAAYTVSDSPVVVKIVYDLQGDVSPLSGSVRNYIDPEKPVALEDWNVLKE
ncbi:MAG: hypothetical protein ACE5G0_14235 [Rhodothermales bacterium]